MPAGISYGVAIFHTQSVFHKSVRIYFIEKPLMRFFWHARRDSFAFCFAKLRLASVKPSAATLVRVAFNSSSPIGLRELDAALDQKKRGG